MTARPARTVLAVDPGRAKCGLAVVDEMGAVLARSVAPTEALAERVGRLAEEWRPVALLVGDGTGGDAARVVLANLPLDIPVEVVDERHTSEQARARWVVETPARGWRKLLPRSLRSPDAAYDDWVAVLLAERWWASPR